MAHHTDLLRQAVHLLKLEPKNPKQASLRRAVSTAYYAVFHLLINEAVANWKRANLRNTLARAFDHNTMKAASNRIQNEKQFPFTHESPAVVSALREVASIFVQLQQERHIADYDNTRFWTRSEALKQVQSAERAFEAWRSIHNEPIAQDYLVSLIVRRRD